MFAVRQSVLPAFPDRARGCVDFRALRRHVDTRQKVTAFLGVVFTTTAFAACGLGVTTSYPAAVDTTCDAARRAIRADRRAQRDFENAAAASERGGWFQSLPSGATEERAPQPEMEHRRRLSAELLAASLQKARTADVALDAARALSEMRARAVYPKDPGGISALDRCRHLGHRQP